MYSTEDEQEPTAKQVQKTLKIPRSVDTGPGTEDGQGPTAKHLQKTSKIQGGSDDESP